MADIMQVGAKPLVLVVEDEAALATMLRYNLEKQGFRVDEAVDGQEALTRIAEAQPDLVLLDWMLPVMSGIEVCRQIRRRPNTRDLPVIMVTARTEDGDAVRGLNTGADDYITKPFNMDALIARMRALLRRSGGVQAKGRLQFHDITMDLSAHRVQRNTRPIHLGPTEFRLLEFFMQHPRRVFSREELLDAVWGRTYTWSRGRWTSTSAACASRSTAPASSTSSALSVRPATHWTPRASDPDPSGVALAEGPRLGHHRAVAGADETMRDTLFALQQRLAAGERDTLVSPAFLMPLPTLRHAERIPSDALAAMRPAWEQVWFPAAPVRVSVLEGVFVAQEGLVLHPDGTVVAATIEQHAPAAIEAAQRAVRAIAGADIRRFTGDVVLCRKSGCAVYGHWLVELLPKAYLASQFPDPCRFLIQALDGPIGRLVVQTLSSLGIALDRVVEAAAEPVWVERLICIHGLTGHGSYMSPLVIDCLQTIAQRVQPAGAESLFILRPPGSGRRLADERRIARAAQEAGFVVLDPSTLPFTAQIAAFKGARRIVGVMGSALANLAFSRPGTRVDILAPATMPDTFFWFIGNHRRLRMTEIRCDTAPGNASPSWNAALYLDSADEHALFTADTAGPAPEAPLFDPAYYADANPDVVTAACDLLDHYMTTGWRERRIPSATFDGNRYLATYPDVAQSGLNPLLHYMKFGLREGRRRFAARSGEGG